MAIACPAALNVRICLIMLSRRYSAPPFTAIRSRNARKPPRVKNLYESSALISRYPAKASENRHAPLMLLSMLLAPIPTPVQSLYINVFLNSIPVFMRAAVVMQSAINTPARQAMISAAATAFTVFSSYATHSTSIAHRPVPKRIAEGRYRSYGILSCRSSTQSSVPLLCAAEQSRNTKHARAVIPAIKPYTIMLLRFL